MKKKLQSTQWEWMGEKESKVQQLTLNTVIYEL